MTQAGSGAHLLDKLPRETCTLRSVCALSKNIVYDGSAWDHNKTAPAASFHPNGFGLYDMHGNAFEWVQDDWHWDYRGAPTDGRAWQENKSIGRVRRGGSWLTSHRLMRSAFRTVNPPDYRSNMLGFRIVCSPLFAR